MSDIKLAPNGSRMHIDTLSLNQDLPIIEIIIEEEKVSQDAKIKIYKPKTQSNSEELF